MPLGTTTSYCNLLFSDLILAKANSLTILFGHLLPVTVLLSLSSFILTDSSCSGIFCRYCRNLFDRDYKATIGVDFEVERFMILDQEFNMQM